MLQYKSFFLAIILTTILQPPDSIKGEFVVRCAQQCGNLEIRYPFGIGNNCSYNDFFQVTCKRSASNTKPKPILTKFNLDLLNLQGYSVSYNGVKGRSFGQITVKTGSVSKACGNGSSSSNNTRWKWNSLNLSGSPYFYDVYQNVFITSFDCHEAIGNASLYNDKGMLIGRCNHHANNTDLESKDPFMRGYSVEVNGRVKGKCMDAFLISKDYAEADPIDGVHFDVPLVLGWYINDYNDLGNYETLTVAVFLGMIAGTVTVTAIIPCCWAWSFLHLSRTTRRSIEARLRAKYFNKRQLETSSEREVINNTKLFTINELKRATHNFSDDRILGRGGQGTVYKGMLRNGQIIAVKVSKTFEERQWKDFINELVVLSQVNHRNIVKILGCCLESDVPLLVYEYISNGNLFHHIHNSIGEFVLAWEMRLRIASEIAGAIAYLHSSSAFPIFHRDIKSTNILLDEKYQAKVSDFGISKAISIDQSHLTTRVLGTFGYLDPEYFRSGQFSEKSDVYSFGVILVELLTGQPPIRVTRTEEAVSLVVYFTSSMEDSALEDILDPKILSAETTKEDIMLVANIAKQCLHKRGAQRPSMKDIASELEGLRKKSLSVPNCSGYRSISSHIESVFTDTQIFEATTICSCPVTVRYNHANTVSENCDEEKCLLFTM